MIMISENAASRNLQRINLWCNCEKQECQVFIPQVICSTNTNQCKCWSVTQEEEDSQASTRHITFHLPFGYAFGRYTVFEIVSQKFYPL